MTEIRTHRKPGWLWIDNEVIDKYGEQIGPYGIAVYAALVRFANNDTQTAAPSVKTIGQKVGISHNKIRSVLQQLKELGLIEIESRWTDEGDRTSNAYTILDVPEDRGYLTGSSTGTSPGEEQVLHPVRSNYTPSEQDLIELDTNSQKVAKEKRDSTLFHSPDEFVDFYNQFKPEECPKVGSVTEARRKKYAAYIKQFPEINYWSRIVSEMHLSQFLRGLKQSGDRQAIARGLDWLCQKGQQDSIENCQKVHEGKYNDARDKPNGLDVSEYDDERPRDKNQWQ